MGLFCWLVRKEGDGVGGRKDVFRKDVLIRESIMKR